MWSKRFLFFPSLSLTHRLYAFGIMSDNLDLDPHTILSQPRHAQASPNWLVMRHPLLEVPHHGLHGLIVQRDMIRIDMEDLVPAFAAGVSQRGVTVFECLVDLRVDSRAKATIGGVPASCVRGLKSVSPTAALTRRRGTLAPTLAGALDVVAGADYLAVAKLRLVALADTGVGVVLEMRHDCGDGLSRALPYLP